MFALFGYIGTPTSLAALPLATEAKVPFFAPFTGAQALREPFNRYAVHVRASYFDETAAIVKQNTSLGIKKIAVFYQNDARGIVISQVMPFPFAANSTLVTEYQNAVKAVAATNKELSANYSSMEGYVAANVLPKPCDALAKIPRAKLL